MKKLIGNEQSKGRADDERKDKLRAPSFICYWLDGNDS